MYVKALLVILSVRLAAFGWFHLYTGLWRYVGMRDILTILKAVTLSTLVAAPVILVSFGKTVPLTVLILDWLMCLALVGGVRLAFRAAWETSRNGHQGRRRALVVGAGDAGDLLVREIERNAALDYHVVGFVDDDPAKLHRRIHGIEVLGAIGDLQHLCREHQVNELLLAIPSASGEQMRRIIACCRAARVEYKTVPSLGELVEAPRTISRVRRVNIDDLLRRAPVKIDHGQLEGFIRHKRVLVTGAGGSIGSELCRQLARFDPAALILVERAENNLFFTDLDLRDRFPKVHIEPVIADITDAPAIRRLFSRIRPQVIFHAAAHKHVPLMEQNRAEAVKNNVLGTKVVADAAQECGAEHFVMISTDKAVRPTSVMGATKRLAETYVQALNSKDGTRFMTVRFGNVLGSEGSVLQVFQRQIESGGPLTVTHPGMKRYFMTIPEACQLVLQAVTQGNGGEIFVLDMGEPVNILDLAKDLIALSGLDPDKDIEIKFTGPRPGEKIFEELLNPETRILPTSHEKIMVVETDSVDPEQLQRGIRRLLALALEGDEDAILRTLRGLVPEYGRGSTRPAPASEQSRILLVEPDGYIRTTLKRVLESRYTVLEAPDRRKALDLAVEQKPDLIILNYDLPGSNLRRLCARLREGNGRTSIILLIESAEVASLQQILDLGADDRLYKPIPVHILETRVKRLLEGKGRGQ